MRNLVCIVEYDGTEFHGFAAQHGTRTVQGVLTESFERLLGSRVQIYGAGRTDAGVHARGQVIHFHTEHPIPVQNLPFAVNKHLPQDLKVRRAHEAPLDFHARFSAQSRVYHYTLYTPRHPSVWCTRYACHYPAPLDIEAMIQAAEGLKGEYDFRSFCADPGEYQTTVRTLYDVKIAPRQQTITFTFEGSAFMRGMVRMLTGALVLIGRGRQPTDYVQRLLALKTERVAYVMPPQGLCLMRVKY